MMNRKQSRNSFLYDDGINSSSSKISFYKKPPCSNDVLIRLILAHSDGMTAMDIWKSIRFVFPYFCKLSSFNLKNMILSLRRSSDVVVMQNNMDNIQIRNYYLRDDIRFSYNLTDIIGQSESLSSFTDETEEKFKKRLKRLCSIQKPTHAGKDGQAFHPSANRPLPGQTHVPAAPASPSPVSPSLASPSFASPSLASPSLASPSLASPSLASPSLASPSLASPSLASPSLASPSLASPSLASPSLASPSLASPSPALPLPSIHPKPRITKKGGTKRKLDDSLRLKMQKNYSIKVFPTVSKLNSLQIHKGHVPRKVKHRRKYKRTSSYKDPSPTRGLDGLTNLESNFGGDHETNTPKDSQQDDCITDMCLKGKNRSHKRNLSYAKSKVARHSSKNNHQDTVTGPLVPSIYEESFKKRNELDFPCVQVGGWFNNPYKNGGEWFNPIKDDRELFDPFKNGGELFRSSYESSDPSIVESNEQEKIEEVKDDLQIVYIKKEADVPDSTQNKLIDGVDDVSLSSEFQKENTPPDDNLVSSSTTHNVNPSHHGSSSTEELWHCQEHMNKIYHLKNDYSWLSFDADQQKLLCSSCDNIKLITCFTDIFEIKSALTAHLESSLHILFPLTKSPIFLKKLYLCLKFSFKKANFLDGVSELLYKIYTKEYSLVLLRLFRNYTHQKLISMIQKHSSPFSLVLNFCQQLAIFRTVDDRGIPFENTLLIEELQDTSVMGLLNSLNLSPKQLIYFTMWPPCGHCKICNEKSNALSEQSFIELPIRFPLVRELLQVLNFDRDIAAYFSAVSVLQSLYREYPHKFQSLKNAHILNNNKPWALAQFIHIYLDEICVICKNLFKTYGEISALGFAARSIKIDDTLLSTIKIVGLVCDTFSDFEENFVKRPTWGEISAMAQCILEKMNNANINERIRFHLSTFLTEVSQQLYYTGYENALILAQLCNASFLSELILLKPKRMEKLKSLFQIFEKFLKIDFDLFIKELNNFGLFLLNQLHFESFGIKSLLEFLNKNPLGKDQFHISLKFFTLLATLPLPFEPSNYSPYWAKVISQQLLDQFGTLHPYILPITLDETVDNASQSIVEFVKNCIQSEVPAIVCN